MLTSYTPGIECAKEQDQKDPLAHLRNKFHIPKNADGEEWLYFTEVLYAKGVDLIIPNIKP